MRRAFKPATTLHLSAFRKLLFLFFLFGTGAVSAGSNTQVDTQSDNSTGCLVSRPVGFIRIEVPAESRRLVSCPFDAFDPAVTSVLAGQLTADADMDQADHIIKWDSQDLSYVQAVRRVDGWYALGTNTEVGELTIVPGEGFWIDNRQAYTQSVMLAGEVLLSPSNTTSFVQGLSLWGYPYASAVALQDARIWDVLTNSSDRLIDAAGEPVSGQQTVMGQGFWYEHNTADCVVWSELRPYADEFTCTNPSVSIKKIEVLEEGTVVALHIANAAATSTSVDVYWQDLASEQPFSGECGWHLAGGQLGLDASATIIWEDRGGTNRLGVSTVPGRYYLVGRTDLDSDSDGVSDVRERFVHGTDPYSTLTSTALASSTSIEPASSNEATRTESSTNTYSGSVSNTPPATPVSIVGRIIYVNRNLGNDVHAGTARMPTLDNGPKKTIRAGLAAVREGGTVVVEGGAYPENMHIGRDTRVHISGTVSVLGSRRTVEPVLQPTTSSNLSFTASNTN